VYIVQGYERPPRASRITRDAAGCLRISAFGYDAALGARISRDPIGENGGLNLYEYVLNSPINAIDLYGFDALILVGGNHANPAYFTNIAQANASGYTSQSGKKATVVQVRSFEDIQNALRNTPNIDRLDYVGHAGPGMLFLSEDGEVSTSDVAQLDISNILPGAQINLEGCNTANGGKNSMAQAFANRFNTNASGFDGGLSFGFPIRFGSTKSNITLGVAMPWFPRGSVTTAHPGQTSGYTSTSTIPF
jgi:RHS repeat-associated protein